MSSMDISYSHRRRTLSTSMSYSSSSEHGGRQASDNHNRQSGRKRWRSQSQTRNRDYAIHRRRKESRTLHTRTHRLNSRHRRARQERSVSRDRGKRRRRASRSPEDRGRGRDIFDKKASRQTHSPTGSRDRSLVARQRKSITPHIGTLAEETSNDSIHRKGTLLSRENSRFEIRAGDYYSNENQRPMRERSLSPFSKRAAMTREIDMGR